MGNTSACCSGTDPNAKCCTTGNQIQKDGAGGIIQAQQMTTSEIAGIDKTPTPGFTAKLEITSEEGERKRGTPGADSAAGGDVRSPVGPVEDAQTVTYEDGSTYTGQVLNGKRCGQGTWQSRAGLYEGQWQGDMQHGTGHQTWSDGRVYDGQFDSGKFSGLGRMVWHTQKGLLTYEGQYKDDLKHGTGKFVWADGRIYDGAWYAGKRHGRGTYINTRSERKIGHWVEDKFDRWETGDNSEPKDALTDDREKQ